jgi:hypothetical protein
VPGGRKLSAVVAGQIDMISGPVTVTIEVSWLGQCPRDCHSSSAESPGAYCVSLHV